MYSQFPHLKDKRFVGTQESASESQRYWSKQGSGERNGPVSRERLEELAEEGDLEPEDLVWRKGFDDWMEAGSLEEVEELFASPPPTLGEQNGEDESAGNKSPTSEKFDVKWGGWILTSESTLTLRKKEIGLVDMGDEEKYLSYEEISIVNAIGGADKKNMVLKAPIGFDDDIDDTKKHNLEFESERDKKRAVEIIERKKEELESQ
jgi:hypothetical protein